MNVDAVLDRIMGEPVEQLWIRQPHLRTVVGFIARNVAQIGLHVYRRDDSNGRTRLRNHPIDVLLRKPNVDMTQFDLLYATVASLCLYDRAYWWIGVDPQAPSGFAIRHIPTPWVMGTSTRTAFAVTEYRVALPNSNGQWMTIAADDMIVFNGWHPIDPALGTSPVLALKTVLAEQVAAQAFREQMWRNGGRVGTYITRPAEAPDWSTGGENSARSRFAQEWKARYSGNDGANAGGTPILEDGMDLKSIAFNPRESQFVEAAKLSLETVAQVYHVNPTMVGLLDNANYSNVQQFHRMLYSDTLGPELERIQQRVNNDLVPRMLQRGASNTYVEFNVQSKLAGSFEEQSLVMQHSIGAPYMTINEGRSRLNLPSVDGGDELVKPLNITSNGDHDPIPSSGPGLDGDGSPVAVSRQLNDVERSGPAL